jgi:hypothetical protein
VKWFSASILVLGVFRHYGWEHMPVDAQRFVWNASGSVMILFLLWATAWPLARLVVLWLTFEELQVIACSLTRIARPQPIGTGQAQCSDLLGFDLGTIGVALVAVILVANLLHPVNPTGSQTRKKK